MIFVSCSFDPFSLPIGESAAALMKQSGIDAYVAKHPEPENLVDFIKAKVKSSEALVALVTEKVSPWQQTEITWAHEFGVPVYAIVQDQVEVRGILQYITKYSTFSPKDNTSLEKAVRDVVSRMQAKRLNKALAELGQILAEKREEQRQKDEAVKALLVGGLVFLVLMAISESK